MAEEKKKRFTKRNLPAPVRLAVETCLARKAEGLCVLDLREISSFTDFFLVMQGNSSRQNAAVAEALEAALKPAGLRPLSVEGRESAEWILLDYGSLVVHVFSRAARDHYSLEKLWGDAPRLDF
ncbi:MAG: ribosome silencing factor [Candidatus Aminicenantes bacterium RBG_16_63_14]|nr:MAG: ribosome silencing factor [Candidatus Aminicenantes bacterium RBG_16_63_14]OGD25948.1 MAG: ribosome silencing factor [Candidatus Aminicenantes bacterium RBG_19FT_COMBO_65_30]